MDGIRPFYLLFTLLWMILMYNQVVALDNSSDSPDYKYLDGLDSSSTVDSNDISSENILVSTINNLKITDFDELENISSKGSGDTSFETTGSNILVSTINNLDVTDFDKLDNITTEGSGDANFETTESNILVHTINTLDVTDFDELDNITTNDDTDNSIGTTEVSTLDTASGILVTYFEEPDNKTLDNNTYIIPEEDEEQECDWSIYSTGNDLNVTWTGNAITESKVTVTATMISKVSTCQFQIVSIEANFSKNYIDLPACSNMHYVVTIEIDCITNETRREVWSAPEPPKEISVLDAQNSSFEITWMKPSGEGEIKLYNISVYNSEGNLNKILTSITEKIKVENLQPFTRYGAQVAAKNEDFWGNYSEIFHVITDVGVPHAPGNLRIKSSTNTSVSLQWEEPTPSTGPVLRYRIHWKNSNASGEEDTNSNNTFYTIAKLLPYVEYTFKVSAVTGAGQGNWSNEVNEQTDIGVPYAPTNLQTTSVKDKSIGLKWDPPKPSTGPVISYRIHCEDSKKSSEINLNTSDTFFTVDHLLHYQHYTFKVRARTKAGLGEWSQTLPVRTDIGIPNAPRNLKAAEVKNTSLILSWEEPTPFTGPILHYKLFGRKSDLQNTSFEMNLDTNKTSYTVTHLAPFVEYTFKVLALTKAGAGPWSKELPVKTDEGVPPAPTALRVTDKTNTSISIQWNKPATSTGPIIRYRVFWSNFSNSWEIDTTSNSTAYKLEHLTPYVHYTLKVLGLTRTGPGDWSEEIQVQTDIGVPHAPKDVTVSNVKNTSLEILWEKPTVSTGPITQYIIHWNYSSEAGEVDTISNIQSYKLDRMAPYCNYTLKVAAVTAAGPGRWSKEVFQRTDIGVPHSPTALSAHDLKNTSISLQWKAPNISTGPIKGYRVHWKNNKNEGEKNTDSTNTFYTLKQLTPFVDYTMKVLALTAAGPGEWSDEIKVRTDVGVPHSPKKLTVTNLRNTSIDLKWEEPAVSTGPILKYRVQWQNSSGFGEEDTGQKKTSYTLKNLAPFVNYTFKVKAVTKAGAGEWSNEQRVQTDIGVPHPPVNLTYLSVTNTSVLLTWLEPRPKTGPVISYTVRWNSQLNSGTKDIKPPQLTHDLTNLLPYVSYTFDVVASTSAGKGEWSRSIKVQTDIGVPTAARNLEAERSNNVSLFIRWDRPAFPNSPEVYYKLTWEPSSRKDINGSEITLHAPSEKVAIRHVITELYPYTNYSIRVYASTKAGQGTVSEELVAQTAVGVPLPAKILHAKSIYNRKALVNWVTEGVYPGPVEYSLQVWKVPGPCSTRIGDYVSKDVKGSLSFEEWKSDHKTEVRDLSPFGNYYFHVSLKTSAIDGIISPQSISILIPSEVPTEPLDVTTACFGSSTELRLNWKPPMRTNGMITSYHIKYGIGNLNSLKVVPVLNMCKDQKYILTGLRPEKRYKISISAKVANVKQNGKSAEARDVCILPAGIPFLGDTSHLLAKGTGPDSLAIEWTKDTFSDYNGTIIEYAILVGKVMSLGNATSGTIADIYPPWINFSNGHSEFYQATPQGWNPFNNATDPLECQDQKMFLRCFIGIEENCDRSEVYCNGPLSPDTKYEVKIQAFTRGGFTETNPIYAQSGSAPKPSITGTVVTIVMAFLFIAFIATGSYIMKKKGYFTIILGKRSKTRTTRNPKEDCLPEEPIPMEECSLTKIFSFIKTKDFAEHVRIMMSDSHLQFSQEFDKLKNESPHLPCIVAEADENRSKNRWMNIFPFDHSRVKLLPLCDEPGSDFINANYIPGYSTKREYIATQGPLPHTVDDFWRMVWEQSVNMIVMLTQCNERGKKKCEQYWPDSGETEYYGDLKISTVSESMLSSFIIRIFRVQLGSYERNIKQMHFTHWPDFGCPEKPEDLINFVNAVRDHLPRMKPGPILVHCSAGVGRTGTFIAVDRLSLQLRNAPDPGEDSVDIYGTVLELRNHRTNMVQTEDQYIYIHLCVRQLIQERDRLQQAESEENIYSNI